MSAGEDDLNFGWLIEGEIAGCAGPASAEDLDYLKLRGIRAVVRLGHPDTDLLMKSSRIVSAGLEDINVPVRDFAEPTPDQIHQVVSFVQEQRKKGNAVAVSCGAGCGRTGTLLACYLVAQGYSADDAMASVRAQAGRGPETQEQEQSIRDFEVRISEHTI